MFLKPTPLNAGDAVALVAPSGAYDRDRLATGVSILESWGLRIASTPNHAPNRYFAGTDAGRADELNRAFADDGVRAVLCVRGGSGAARLHRRVDPRTFRGAPKIFVGFSDITTLLMRFVQEAELVCYHGPMVGADLPRLNEDQRERFRRFLFGEDGWWDGRATDVIREGVSDGTLAGGCLSVLVTTLGTPYEVDTRGSVLFIEDVAEKPYRIDRMLTHLVHAGKFDDVRALVLGPMTSCDDGAGQGVLGEIIADVLADYRFPILFGLDAGHGAGNVVLPFGCRVGVDGSKKKLQLLESAFA